MFTDGSKRNDDKGTFLGQQQSVSHFVLTFLGATVGDQCGGINDC
jgi:hypothetical protein